MPQGEKGRNTAQRMRQEHRNPEEIVMDSGDSIKVSDL